MTNEAKTCPRGHEKSEKNWYANPSGSYCRVCANEAARRRRPSAAAKARLTRISIRFSPPFTASADLEDGDEHAECCPWNVVDRAGLLVGHVVDSDVAALVVEALNGAVGR